MTYTYRLRTPSIVSRFDLVIETECRNFVGKGIGTLGTRTLNSLNWYRVYSSVSIRRSVTRFAVVHVTDIAFQLIVSQSRRSVRFRVIFARYINHIVRSLSPTLVVARKIRLAIDVIFKEPQCLVSRRNSLFRE